MIYRFLFLFLMPLSAAPLVPRGADWRYYDGAAAPADGWNKVAFDDSSWSVGAAPLGYGEKKGLGTHIKFGGDPGKKHITSYYRHRFTVDDPSQVATLKAGLRRDDGAVIYLNGREVIRSAMPKGKITHKSFSATTATGKAETAWHEFSLSTASLRKGTNVVAAEVHQATRRSSDVVFDFSLRFSSAGVSRGPYLQQATDTSIVVRWRTGLADRGAVRFGTSPDSLDETVKDKAPTTEHELILAGLKPSTRYYYQVCGAAGAPACDVYSFTTSPTPGVACEARVWVLGDCGTANKNQRAVRDAFHKFRGNRDADLVLLLGDNAYPNGTDEEYQRAIFEIYTDTLPRLPFWSTLGNHDTGQKSAFNGKYPYFEMFSLPTKGEAGGLASGTEHYYSFDYGNIHFVCLDSMTADRSPKGAMAEWLRADLQANTSTWLIAFWHHPPYTKGSHDSDVEKPLYEMRRTFCPILEKYGVDLIMSGHSHCYERSFLIDSHYGDSASMDDTLKKDGGDGRPDGDGAYVKPLGGSRAHHGAVYTVAGASGKISGGSLDHPAMFISINDLGSVVLDVKGSRLDASFVHPKNNGKQPGFEVRDHFTIVKKAVAE